MKVKFTKRETNYCSSSFLPWSKLQRGQHTHMYRVGRCCYFEWKETLFTYHKRIYRVGRCCYFELKETLFTYHKRIYRVGRCCYFEWKETLFTYHKRIYRPVLSNSNDTRECTYLLILPNLNSLSWFRVLFNYLFW